MYLIRIEAIFMTKLTLSADGEVVAMAKDLAERQGQSVSALFANFIRSQYATEKRSSFKAGPMTKKALAIGKSIQNNKTTDRELLEDALLDLFSPPSCLAQI